MRLVSPALAALVLLIATTYAQIEIPHHVAGGAKTAFARLLLLGVGVVLGLVGVAWYYPADPPLAALAFLIGVGCVHFPAALILFLKHESGAGRS